MTNLEKPPVDSSEKGLEYAKQRMDKLMRETFADLDTHWKFNKNAIVDILGYPVAGYRDNEFSIRLLVIVDPTIDNLGSDKQFVAVRIDKGFVIKGDQLEGGFSNSTLMTSEQKPTEADLQGFFESGGQSLYRISI